MRTTPRRICTASAVVLLVTSGLAAVLVGTGSPAQAARRTAACSGTSADSATIQGAINGSAPGDEIVISGSCSISQTVKLLGGRSYRGDSASTRLTEASGRNLPAVLASDSWVDDSTFTGDPVTLRDLTVDANKAQNPTCGDGVVIRSWNTVVENVRIENARGNGLRVTGTSANGTPLANTQVNGSVRGVFITGSGRSGIYVQDAGNAVTDWNLSDSWVANSGGDAIRLENAAGWTVERNHVYGVGGSGIKADRLFASSISDNYVEDFAVNGIGVTVQGDAASTISGNRVFRFSGAGTTYIAVTQVNYGSGRLAVTGNVVRGAGTGVGLSFRAGANTLQVTSAGNLVTDVTTPRVTGAGVTLVTSV